MTLPAEAAAVEPETSIETIANLPFFVMGRFPKPYLIGRCAAGKVDGFSAKEFFERIRDLSLGLSALGVTRGDRVAIVAESRPEWLIADLAILTLGAVTVPIYPTLSAAQVRYILGDSGARAVFLSTRLQAEKVQQIRHELPALEAIIVMDAAVANTSPSVTSIQALAERGHQHLAKEWGVGKAFKDRAEAIGPSDLATIIYTSGTTGEPKGVMLSHSNLVANIRGSANVLNVSQDDVALSFLPLSHAFERMVVFVYLISGVTINFAESFDTLARDISAVRPTILTGVPRVYEKLYARISDKGQTGTGMKPKIFKWAAGVAQAKGHAALRGTSPGVLTSLQAPLAERLVFAKIRESLGGRIRYLVSGSAPLPAAIAEFFLGVGLPIVEGYGLTETAPILTVNPPAAPRGGSVGKPIPGVDIRIADDGEILARGANVMSGYYNKDAATNDALRDGWFHTGDIGTIDGEGYLRITDRKKDLLVTSGGKKIAPQPIEAVLKRSPIVAEAVLLGDRQKYAAALIVPEFNALDRRLKDLGLPPGSREELVKRADVIKLYDEIVDALNRELSQFERIKKFALLPAEFTVESGELTPTLKVKRKVVEERWKAAIGKLYQD